MQRVVSSPFLVPIGFALFASASGCWSFDYDTAATSATSAAGGGATSTSSPAASNGATGSESGTGSSASSNAASGSGGAGGGSPVVTTVAVGGDASCALDVNGKVWCWGREVYGELGDGLDGYEAHPAPQQVSLPGQATQLAMGETFGCALVDSDLYCWGRNQSSQVGQPVSTLLPVTQVHLGGGDTKVESFALGASHGCAVTTIGQLYCWGSNASFQAGDTTPATIAPPIKVGVQDTVESVHAGGSFTCLVAMGDSTPRCFGDNSAGQLGWSGGSASATPGAIANGSSSPTWARSPVGSTRAPTTIRAGATTTPGSSASTRRRPASARTRSRRSIPTSPAA